MDHEHTLSDMLYVVRAGPINDDARPALLPLDIRQRVFVRIVLV